MAPPKGPRTSARRPHDAVAWLALPLTFTAVAEFEPLLTAHYGPNLRLVGDDQGVWILRPTELPDLVDLGWRSDDDDSMDSEFPPRVSP